MLSREILSSVWKRYADAIRPLPPMTVSEFANKYRVLHAVYCVERPGKWDGDVFPYQAPLMDMIGEAIETGKRGFCLMKSGQGGGTDLAINGGCWLKEYYPGPQLFLTSTEDVAREFGRERFKNIIDDMEPLRAKYLENKHGDILTKRFTDGKIQLVGGQSVFKLQSTPYRHVTIDEVDSLVENLGGEGDPVKLAEIRTDSYVGPTLMIAYAHPTTKDRGAGKLFFEMSDMRRGFVKHDCGAEFWLQWEHIKVVGSATDPSAYTYVCPQCGATISDAERVAMVRKVKYKSTLPPEEAVKKTWIGGHFSQLYYPGKTLRSLAQRWIDCGDDENAKRVFWNKILGEPYDPKVKKIDANALRALICVKRRANDPEFYLRGQVPPGVRFLTAGQDSRAKELHYTIWGWGLRRRVDKTLAYCGWLIDWGEIKREYSLLFSDSEYHVFDDLIYRRRFPSTVGDKIWSVRQCGHDIGYQPTQIPIIRYCRSWQGRAIPTKGASLEATSYSRAPYAKWGSAMKFKQGENQIEDTTSQQLLFNTYLLKSEMFGWFDASARFEITDSHLGARRVAHITLPEDVDELFLEQSKNESLVKGKKNNELIWKATGPNHLADCNAISLGLAHNLDWFQKNQTAEEAAEQKKPVRTHQASHDTHDPSLG